jgi:ribosomal protein S27AE
MDLPPKGGSHIREDTRGFRLQPEGGAGDTHTGDTICPRCSESQDLAKIKGCIRCLKCGFKFDCNGW